MVMLGVKSLWARKYSRISATLRVVLVVGVEGVLGTPGPSFPASG